MAFPLIPVVLVGAGAAALVGFLALRKKGSASGVEELPAKMQQPFTDLLTKGSDPDSLDAVAAKLESFGFKKQGAALRARSAALRGGGPVQPAPGAPGPGPGNIPAPPKPSPAPTPPAPPAPAPPAPPAPTQIFARVTTNDPPPSGDLKVFSDASGSQQIGGAEKGSLVTVVAANPGGLSRVRASNPGGRYPAVEGFVHSQFLVPANPSATSGLSPTIIGARHPRQAVVGSRHPKQAVVGLKRSARGVAFGARSVPGSSGRASTPPSPIDVKNLHPKPLVLLRQPTRTSKPSGSVLASGSWGKLLQAVGGPKTSATSPGAGGWALVSVGSLATDQGWVPLEWLGADVSKRGAA